MPARPTRNSALLQTSAQAGSLRRRSRRSALFARLRPCAGPRGGARRVRPGSPSAGPGPTTWPPRPTTAPPRPVERPCPCRLRRDPRSRCASPPREGSHRRPRHLPPQAARPPRSAAIGVHAHRPSAARDPCQSRPCPRGPAARARASAGRRGLPGRPPVSSPDRDSMHGSRRAPCSPIRSRTPRMEASNLPSVTLPARSAAASARRVRHETSTTRPDPASRLSSVSSESSRNRDNATSTASNSARTSAQAVSAAARSAARRAGESVSGRWTLRRSADPSARAENVTSPTGSSRTGGAWFGSGRMRSVLTLTRTGRRQPPEAPVFAVVRRVVVPPPDRELPATAPRMVTVGSLMRVGRAAALPCTSATSAASESRRAW